MPFSGAKESYSVFFVLFSVRLCLIGLISNDIADDDGQKLINFGIFEAFDFELA